MVDLTFTLIWNADSLTTEDVAKRRPLYQHYDPKVLMVCYDATGGLEDEGATMQRIEAWVAQARCYDASLPLMLVGVVPRAGVKPPAYLISRDQALEVAEAAGQNVADVGPAGAGAGAGAGAQTGDAQVGDPHAGEALHGTSATCSATLVVGNVLSFTTRPATRAGMDELVESTVRPMTMPQPQALPSTSASAMVALALYPQS